MPNRYSIADARNSLPRLIRQAERGRDVQLTRRGKPVAVLVGIQEYEHFIAGRGGFWSRYEAFRREFDLAGLGIQPRTIFQRSREDTGGREFSW